MNRVRECRLASAFTAFRQQRTAPWFSPRLREALEVLLRVNDISMSREDIVDFWTWFCQGNMRDISTFTEEEILWGVERFINEFSPIDDGRFEVL